VFYLPKDKVSLKMINLMEREVTTMKIHHVFQGLGPLERRMDGVLSGMTMEKFYIQAFG